ncbi:hypothetical protein MAR_ORF003 [Marseillevirus marseillevirus]|uniref:Uncharacterized protein n=1 Tax=Marseillevirus marseillevirus TaxID=694581 RepID=D2XA19_GBMV|nr:hypothetical protein MAR_ORF003 [Marseillevirus marseillevirus]ADB03796.1 hypothetical protein MAR_ORF003 [Marseillevirus marseillevirus]
MTSALLPKVLQILEGYLVDEKELDIEQYDSEVLGVHIFAAFYGHLCSWQELKDGTFRERSTLLPVSEEKMLEILSSRFSSLPELDKLKKERERSVPGFHFESQLLPLVLPFLLEDCRLEESDIGISYSYNPGNEPSKEEIDYEYTWVNIHSKDTKKTICRWYEEVLSTTKERFCVGDNRGLLSAGGAVGEILKVCKSSDIVLSLVIEKLVREREENSLLRQRNEKLRLRVEKYKFAPGSAKSQELRAHFLGLAK